MLGELFAARRNKLVNYPDQITLPDGASPPVLNNQFSVTAEIDIRLAQLDRAADF
jgi:hypothetical protein